MFISIITVAIIGLIVSSYAWYVESRIKRELTYKPACDISDHISCSKPLQSPYSHLFYISNTIAGILFYVLTIGLALVEYKTALLFATTCSLAVTVYLAYILIAKIRALCPLCVCLYVVNALLWVLSVYIYIH